MMTFHNIINKYLEISPMTRPK